MRASRTRRNGPASPTPDPFFAVADPTRRRIIELLARGELPVHRLAGAFRISRPAISKHLRILKAAGVVTERPVGRERLYRFRPRGLTPTINWLAHYQRFWEARLATLGTILAKADHE